MFEELDDQIGYRPYTREFDVITDVGRLFDKEQFARLAQLVTGYREKAGVALAEVVDALPRTILASFEEAGAAPQDTTVLFLVDGSGSTRGATAVHMTTATIEACLALEELGVETSVLGYSTATWKGGEARKKWLAEGKPVDPGRLCDLLHVVYKTPAMKTTASIDRLCAMAADTTKRENVDGEALVWARECIDVLRRPNKIIVNLTDGFMPIDDSTIYSNRANPLTLHVLGVCDAIEQEGAVSLSRVFVDMDDDHLKARQNILDNAMTVFRRDSVTTEKRDLFATMQALVEGLDLAIRRSAELAYDFSSDAEEHDGAAYEAARRP